MTDLADQEHPEKATPSRRSSIRWAVPVLVIAALLISGAGIAFSQGFFDRLKPVMTPTPTRTSTPDPTATPTVTPTDTPTFTPLPTDTPTPTFTPVPTDTPTPTFTPVPTNTPVPTSTPTFTPLPTATNTPLPTPTPAARAAAAAPPAPAAAPATSPGTCGQSAEVLVAPIFYAPPVAGCGAGESLSVKGRAPTDGWYYVRVDAGVEGFVEAKYVNWYGDYQKLPVVQPPDGWIEPQPGEAEFTLDYKGCVPHAFGLGSVKGQVLDRAGNPIVGAQVEMWLNGQRWEDPANPAATNEDGWYEWILVLDQNVSIYALFVGGRRVGFAPMGLNFITKAGCFHHVNFVQQ